MPDVGRGLIRKGSTDTGDLDVIFGTGPLGQAVMREFINRSERVQMVNRSGERGAPQEGEVLATDACDPAAVHDMTRGEAVVYQCAQPRHTEWPTRFQPLQAAIIEGLARAGTRIVIAENLYMYGDTDGRSIRETLPYSARCRIGWKRARMAEEALGACGKSRRRGVAQGGEGLRARIRTQVCTGPYRRQERAVVSARLRMVTGWGDNDLAVLRRLAKGRQPRAWHV